MFDKCSNNLAMAVLVSECLDPPFEEILSYDGAAILGHSIIEVHAADPQNIHQQQTHATSRV